MTLEPWDRDRRELWRLYSSVGAQLSDRLDGQLQQYHELALIDYEILSSLVTAPERRLRMSELANHVLVSRSRLTYRIDRLVGVGFVSREECEDDRRGMWAIVTDAGHEAYADARTSHETAIDGWFFNQIPDDQLGVLTEILTNVGRKLSEGSDPAS